MQKRARRSGVRPPGHGDRGVAALTGAFVAVALAGILASPAGATATDDPAPGNPGIRRMDEAGDHSLGAGNVHERSRSKRDLSAADLSLLSGKTRGMDVSGWQADKVDWEASYAAGARFVYIKATEDSDYRSAWYDGQRAGALAAGLAVGAYHYANPAYSTAEAQADYFFGTGVGGKKWTADGRTLPPMVDLEPARAPLKTCYGLSKSELKGWVDAFLKRTESLFGRAPVVYTSASWWDECIGADERFASYPLAIAHWGGVGKGPGALPGNWDDWTFWQHWNDAEYAGPGILLAGDQQLFNGDIAALTAFARGETGADAAPGDPAGADADKEDKEDKAEVADKADADEAETTTPEVVSVPDAAPSRPGAVGPAPAAESAARPDRDVAPAPARSSAPAPPATPAPAASMAPRPAAKEPVIAASTADTSAGAQRLAATGSDLFLSILPLGAVGLGAVLISAASLIARARSGA